jgi:hypothetical protein
LNQYNRNGGAGRKGGGNLSQSGAESLEEERRSRFLAVLGMTILVGAGGWWTAVAIGVECMKTHKKRA